MKGLFKKLLQGFIFGLGFGVAFILVVFFFSPYIFENSVTSSLEWSNTEDNEINQPPPIKEEYLGSTGVSASNTADVGNKVLTSGGGRITGVVVGDGARVAGVTLRLGGSVQNSVSFLYH
ncbi:hypothetical protein [uncultured Gilvimarinus sp.]|uniref:hypothetical protein n=1 Tax=uncultured Gilvimarinus sp. TaxID=1689143 RepID=UPI0030DCF58A